MSAEINSVHRRAPFATSAAAEGGAASISTEITITVRPHSDHQRNASSGGPTRDEMIFRISTHKCDLFRYHRKVMAAERAAKAEAEEMAATYRDADGEGPFGSPQQSTDFPRQWSDTHASTLDFSSFPSSGESGGGGTMKNRSNTTEVKDECSEASFTMPTTVRDLVLLIREEARAPTNGALYSGPLRSAASLVADIYVAGGGGSGVSLSGLIPRRCYDEPLEKWGITNGTTVFVSGKVQQQQQKGERPLHPNFDPSKAAALAASQNDQIASKLSALLSQMTLSEESRRQRKALAETQSSISRIVNSVGRVPRHEAVSRNALVREEVMAYIRNFCHCRADLLVPTVLLYADANHVDANAESLFAGDTAATSAVVEADCGGVNDSKATKEISVSTTSPTEGTAAAAAPKSGDGRAKRQRQRSPKPAKGIIYGNGGRRSSDYRYSSSSSSDTELANVNGGAANVAVGVLSPTDNNVIASPADGRQVSGGGPNPNGNPHHAVVGAASVGGKEEGAGEAAEGRAAPPMVLASVTPYDYSFYQQQQQQQQQRMAVPHALQRPVTLLHPLTNPRSTFVFNRAHIRRGQTCLIVFGVPFSANGRAAGSLDGGETGNGPLPSFHLSVGVAPFKAAATALTIPTAATAEWDSPQPAMPAAAADATASGADVLAAKGAIRLERTFRQGAPSKSSEHCVYMLHRGGLGLSGEPITAPHPLDNVRRVVMLLSVSNRRDTVVDGKKGEEGEEEDWEGAATENASERGAEAGVPTDVADAAASKLLSHIAEKEEGQCVVTVTIFSSTSIGGGRGVLPSLQRINDGVSGGVVCEQSGLIAKALEAEDFKYCQSTRFVYPEEEEEKELEEGGATAVFCIPCVTLTTAKGPKPLVPPASGGTASLREGEEEAGAITINANALAATEEASTASATAAAGEEDYPMYDASSVCLRVDAIQIFDSAPLSPPSLTPSTPSRPSR